MLIERALPWSMSYRELRANGASRDGINLALASGALIRARRDNYLPGDCPSEVVAAVRVGGRLDCVSLLRLLGVFVMKDDRRLHLQIPRARTLLRSPTSRAVRLDGTLHGVVTHWRDDPIPERSTVADIAPAIARAVICQEPRAAIATLDSAIHVGLLPEDRLSEVFALLPHRLRRLRIHIDGRAESGPESLVRLIARSTGAHVEVQVMIDGVGRVDILIDGWLIVECDSRAHHATWEQQQEDRRRDLEAARRGFVTLRPTARQIFDTPHLVREAIWSLLQSGRPAQIRQISPNRPIRPVHGVVSAGLP